MAHVLNGRGLGALVAAAALWALPGCKALFESGVDDGLGSEVAGSGVGEECGRTSDCRRGLVCESDGTNDVCTFSSSSGKDDSCLYTEECVTGLYCDHTRTCQDQGTVAVGGACTTTDDCTRGNICVLSGFSANCVATGEEDIGGACAVTSDCFAGLTCGGGGDSGTVCTAPIAQPAGTPALPPIPLWSGEDCGPETTAATAYFDVPRGGAELADFYRLPFPNDIRMKDGHLDMSGHPAPPTVLNVPIIQRYLDAVEGETGFSTNPVVFFRFSQEFDWDNARGALVLVDITESSPTYGQTVGLHWLTTGGRVSKYLCSNWLAFAPGVGTTLRPGTTYAALLKTSIKTKGGASFARSNDLNALLSSNAPGNADLAAAHTLYAPLRSWLADSSNGELTADEVLNATVFTTHEPETLLPKLREAVRADAMPTLSDVTVCESASTVSPCADDTEQRSCSAPNARFTEIHGRIALPIFQHGTAPYEDPEDGGGFEVDSSGTPTIARHESVCFALTVPKTAIPAEGFPLMLFAHGTGGSFTNAVRNGLAADVADDTAAAATLAIDLPQHGARRNGSTQGSDRLFYNFLNPAAARDNVLQGSADLFTLVRWAATFTQDASATGGEVHFNADRIAVFAHSQGATHASLMFPYEPQLTTVLLSGNGGHLTTSLLTKENPINIKAAVPFAMLDSTSEGKLAGGEFHPMLALFQTYFDRVDPVNFGRVVHTAPSSLAPEGRHLFMTYGLGDTYSTEPTMEAYARSASLPLVLPSLADVGLAERAAPLSGNVMFDTVSRTVGLRQYDPSGSMDGHFVSTDTGRADVLAFLRAALSGGSPAIGQ